MAWRWQLLSLLLWLPSFWNENESSRRIFLNTDSEEPFSIANKQYRAAFHFQPPQNWLNGPMLYNGIYHLFYQYNPYSAEWGNITWGHSISTDLINWTPLEIALRPSEPFDLLGCWSGSATILPGNKPVILYTGIDESGHNVQNIALPKQISDPFLLEWVKPPYNPVMVAAGVDPTQFRDPSTCWLGKDGLWRTTVGAEDFERKAKALLYRSKDFMRWTRAENPLFSTNSSSMIECIDFFPTSVKWKTGLDGSTMGSEETKHVLKMGVSDNSHDYYLIGRYLEESDEFIPDNAVEDDHRLWLRYDYGSFYASKTFFDAEKRRRVLSAWSNESDTISDDIAKGWAGVLADIDVEFELPELKKAELIRHEWKLDDAQMACDQMDASVPGSIGPFGLLVLASRDLEEHTAIFFRVFKTAFGGFVGMDIKEGKISLRTLIDHSVVESFGAGGRTCITASVYPKSLLTGGSHIYVFNNGTETVKMRKMTAWEMGKAQIN